jgi:hypothetical protein
MGTMVTLTMGYTFRLKEGDVTKGKMVAICREISEMFGPGHEFRPLAGKGLQWRKWPGKREDDVMSGKEIRLLPPEKNPEPIAWPRDVPDNVMQVRWFFIYFCCGVLTLYDRQLWDEDPSLCLRQGFYQTQLVAYGEVKRWTYPELDRIRDVLMRHGWWVSLTTHLRGLGKASKRTVRPDDGRYFYGMKETRRNAIKESKRRRLENERKLAEGQV